MNLNYAEQAVRPSTQLDEVYETLRQASEVSYMLISTANKLVGAVPTVQTSSTKLNEVADGVIPDLAQKSRDASKILSEAIEAVHRINRAIGI